MKPRSRTGTLASSSGRRLPFRKTMRAPLLDPQAQCIPRASEDAGHAHWLEGHDRILAEGLAVVRDAQRTHALALSNGRKERLLREQLSLQLVGLALGHGHDHVGQESGLHLAARAFPDLDRLDRLVSRM